MLLTFFFLSFNVFSVQLNQNEERHGDLIYNYSKLETELSINKNDYVRNWDLATLIGSDENKFFFKSEGKYKENDREGMEFLALYSRYVSTFWDMQLGIRRDYEPEITNFFVAGFYGLTPYFFESELYLFVSEDKDIFLRGSFDNTILLSQVFSVNPYIESNLSFQNSEHLNVGSGLSDIKLGTKIKYEFDRKFAPYLDLNLDKKFGETSKIANRNGERKSEFLISTGLMFIF